MRITELDPRWVGIRTPASQAAGIHIGISFDCPCCVGEPRATRLAVMFNPPIDPDNLLAATTWVMQPQWWQRIGDSFDDFSLSPSVDASQHGHWHGHITNGEIVGGI